jgi:hypothetical protein
MERNEPSRKQEEMDSPEIENSFLGGVIRNILRSVGYVTRIESIGRLPVRIPTKIVAKSADKIGQLTDMIDNLQTAYNDIKERKMGSKFRSLFHTSLRAYHGVVKSGVLGGVLFSLYEEIISQVNSKQCLSISNQSKHFDELVLSASLVSTSAGLVSGGSHGILYTLWDRSLYTLTSVLKLPDSLSNGRQPPFFTCGTCLSHSLVHGSLFGGYEFTKRLSLYLMNLSHQSDHLTKVEGGLSILFGGLAGGMLSETVSAFTAPLEEAGLRDGMREIGRRGWPEIKFSVRSIGPTLLGFFAYEYAKDGFETAD